MWKHLGIFINKISQVFQAISFNVQRHRGRQMFRRFHVNYFKCLIFHWFMIRWSFLNIYSKKSCRPFANPSSNETPFKSNLTAFSFIEWMKHSKSISSPFYWSRWVNETLFPLTLKGETAGEKQCEVWKVMKREMLFEFQNFTLPLSKEIGASGRMSDNTSRSWFIHLICLNALCLFFRALGIHWDVVVWLRCYFEEEMDKF